MRVSGGGNHCSDYFLELGGTLHMSRAAFCATFLWYENFFASSCFWRFSAARLNSFVLDVLR